MAPRPELRLAALLPAAPLVPHFRLARRLRDLRRRRRVVFFEPARGVVFRIEADRPLALPKSLRALVRQRTVPSHPRRLTTAAARLRSSVERAEMRGRCAFGRLVAAATCAAALLGPAASAGGAVRDDSAWLQAKLDAGGDVFLPRLPNGRCYATRGLWVSRDDTTITSDGACIVALGPGEGRIPRADGTFVTATAVFYVDHSDLRKPLPVRIAISGLHITVPAGKRMHGVSVLGHEVTLNDLTIDGSPLTD